MCTTDQKLFKAYTVFDSERFLFMDEVLVIEESTTKKAQLKQTLSEGTLLSKS